MTSIRQVAANHANARASTGPRTAAGRSRSSRNAVRHGLNVPIRDLEIFSNEVDTLTLTIVADDAADLNIERCARALAESLIDLKRAREARHHYLASKLSQTDYGNGTIALHYKAPPLSLGTAMRAQTYREFLKLRKDSLPKGAENFALILQQEARQFALFDRYEGRAWQRRNRAIRALDEARQLKMQSCKASLGQDRTSSKQTENG